MLTRFQSLRWRALCKLLCELPEGKVPTYEERSWTTALNLMMSGRNPGDKVLVRGKW